jgi:sucrose phosphorylase
MESSQIRNRIQTGLTSLYGAEKAEQIWIKLENSLENFQHPKTGVSTLDTLNNLDALLITYADQFQVSGQPHLVSLAGFIKEHLEGLISAVHLLPFFPYSSDDGFSVIDYKKVDPQMGDWDDLQDLRSCCNLMYDAVINHISSQSDWFQNYLAGQEPYTDYFIEVDPGIDLSQVTRPRAKPLLTEVMTKSGPAYVWTTFSPDQIDLNYANPDVLLEIIDVLLYYVEQGARLIRLDAIAYLWKEIGTTCIHLPQAHEIIKLIRSVLDLVAPEVILITETNVPHQENISYFGKQLEGGLGDEAQMVYQFPLAPLVLHTFRTGDASILSRWASSLEMPFSSAAFLNFIASHDGIGVRPAEGLLSDQDLQNLVEQTLAHGGQVSYKTNPDGTQSPYELNITLYDMLNPPDQTPLDLGVRCFMASQAIILSLAGTPGIYVHSLFGAANSHENVEKTGRARSINREKYMVDDLVNELQDPGSRSARVFKEYAHLLRIRKAQPAFNPLSPQQILDLDSRLFALLRGDSNNKVLCLINISSETVKVELSPDLLGSSLPVDLLTDREYSSGKIQIDPYQTLWLT